MSEPDDPSLIDTFVRPFSAFARHRAAGAILLLGATALAILWANSPWRGAYFDLLATRLTVGVGEFELSKPLLKWINNGLMGLFFFTIGLELKRELLAGHLAAPRRAMLPMAAAIGGMLVPALVYLAFNPHGEGSRAWGAPMATDIAFALGVLALVGPRVPTGLKVFLAALAIVDDLGAIVVIALFYTDGVVGLALAIGLIVFCLSLLANRAGLRNQVVFFLMGSVVWFAFLQSGVHATVAAVLMAFTIPARTRRRGGTSLLRLEALLDRLRDAGSSEGTELRTVPQQQALEEMADVVDEASAPLQRLEHALLPLITFFVLPAFALANAGVVLEGDLAAVVTNPVSLGAIFGLFVGKQVGIVAFSWLAVRLGWATLPEGAGWRHVHAVAVLGGIGFTMALFIGGLGLTDPELHRAVKVGILLASLASGLLGVFLLRRLPPAEHVDGNGGGAHVHH